MDLPLQVRRGAIGAQCGLVFAYNGASEKFHAEEHFKRFESYDKWKLREFKQFLKTRYKWTFCNAYMEKKCYIWSFCSAAGTTENYSKWLTNGASFVICLILMTISLMCWRKYVYRCCFQLLDLKACYKRDIAKQTFYLGCRSTITEIFKLSFITSVFRTVA